MLLEEPHHLGIAVQLIGQLHNAVAFVAIAQVLDGNAPVFQILDDLFRPLSFLPTQASTTSSKTNRSPFAGSIELIQASNITLFQKHRFLYRRMPFFMV